MTDRAWVDVRRGWVDGTDGLLDHLVAEVTWHQGRRHMYDRMVDDPRLSHWCRNEAALPHPVLTDIATAL
ncbi:MAG: alpha-ketoglutarate-dependent dioxygenase AlkB, partial [Acidimicrobiia bacterium]